MVHLPSCQLHISVNRTAQIYLELHFCVELHTKKALLRSQRQERIHVTSLAASVENCFAVQSVSVIVDGAGSRDLDRDAADRKISSVYLLSGFRLGHLVGVCAEPHSEIVVHTHDAGARSPHLHRLTTATAVHAASS